MRAQHTTRLLIALAICVALGVILVALLMASDTALSLWQRLRDLSPWLARIYLAALGLLAAASLWFTWRLLRAGKKTPSTAPVKLSQTQLEQAIQQLEAQGANAATARQELHFMQQRQNQHDIYVALFGEVSSGKSSLINALLPGARQSTSVLGGTTRQVHYFDWAGPVAENTKASTYPLARNIAALNFPIQLVDLPGFAETDAGPLMSAAQSEAARAHVVIYLCDGDLNRKQFEQLNQLIALGKPLIIAINKVDRYQAQELALIEQRLRAYLPVSDTGETALAPIWRLVTVQTGGTETLRVIDANGHEQWQERPRPNHLDGLIQALLELLAQHHPLLRQRQQESSLILTAQALAQSTRNHREQAAVAIVQRYARRAVAGALAAVAPGADLVIQGALATALVRALCQLYEVPVREVDIDRFLSHASGKLKRNTSLVLAVAGNALKAFPGLGTVAGGLVHALAYGMIFHNLGHALASTLASALAQASETNQLKPLPWQSDASRATFEEQWLGHMETPAKYLVRAALEQFQRQRPRTEPAAAAADNGHSDVTKQHH